MVTEEKPATLTFDALYRENVNDLFAYVITLVRDRASAEDVTHVAFERAYRKHRRYDAAKGSQRAWLFGIARNASLDELRRRKRSASLLVDLPDDSVAAFEDEEAALRQSAVRSALARLEPRERELVSLKFFTGLSNAEIAEVLGLSESNVGTRLHRAVNRLREACNV